MKQTPIQKAIEEIEKLDYLNRLSKKEETNLPQTERGITHFNINI